MALTIILILLGLWVFSMAIKFYGRTDWDEAPEPSPDLQGMHKRQAELLHIQEVMEEAVKEKKLSNSVLDEYNKFCAAEIEALQKTERAWKARKKNKPSSGLRPPSP